MHSCLTILWFTNSFAQLALNNIQRLFIHIYAVLWSFRHILHYQRTNIMNMIHRKLIVQMQIGNWARLIHRPTSFTPKAQRSSYGTIGIWWKASTYLLSITLVVSLSLSLKREQRKCHLNTVTCGWMRDIISATSSSKELITEQIFKKGERERLKGCKINLISLW